MFSSERKRAVLAEMVQAAEKFTQTVDVLGTIAKEEDPEGGGRVTLDEVGAIETVRQSFAALCERLPGAKELFPVFVSLPPDFPLLPKASGQNPAVAGLATAGVAVAAGEEN